MTQAIRALKDHNFAFVIQAYAYENHGGTALGAREMGVDEHRWTTT